MTIAREFEEDAPAKAKRITVAVCEDHGLAFETTEAALEHERADGCGRWRVKRLDELQRQMDEAQAVLDEADRDLAHAQAAISAAASRHYRVRQVRDVAATNAAAAKRLWAERARDQADRILEAAK